jgi:hypothetical protein
MAAVARREGGEKCGGSELVCAGERKTYRWPGRREGEEVGKQAR